MWFYTDIIELPSVGDIQAQFLEYVPIQSKFDEMEYCNFNPLF